MIAGFQKLIARKKDARKEKDTRGSRFTVLSEESPLEVEKDTSPQQVEKVTGVGVAILVVQLDVINHASALPERTSESAEQARLAIPTGNLGIGAVPAKDDVSVASSEMVVRASSSLNGDKHVAVRIGSEEDLRMTRIGRGRILPVSIRGLASKSGYKVQLGVKSISKVTLKSSKSDDRGALKNGPGDHLNNLVSDLNKAAFYEELRQAQSRDIDDTEEGALDPGFNRSFKLLVRRQKPDIVVIMEPRISGREADRFIHRSGFEFSYRVEANGFSGGIWVLWRGTINVQVLAVSNQYIHALCSAGDGGDSFFGTFIYASPNAARRRTLLEQLLALDPGSASPWVLGGDLNVIGTVLERSGGSSRRSGVCSLFSDFMFDSGLIDLGYNGPQYTWRRGNLFQRLNRCLCNSTWVRLFPHSEVYHLLKLGSDHRPIMLSTMKIGTKPVSRPFRFRVGIGINRFLGILIGGNLTFSHAYGVLKGLWRRRIDLRLCGLRSGLKRNMVRMLRIEDGEWCDDPTTLRNHAVSFFRHLFAAEGLQPRSGSNEANFRNGCSRLWTCLCTIWEDLKECIHWEVRDGKDTDFWYDHWLRKEPRLVTAYFGATVPRPVRVGEMVLANGEWDWDALAAMLPKDKLDLIASVLPPQEGVGVDTPGWRWEDKRLLTNVERARRHMTSLVMCEICGSGHEDIEHVLRSCTAAKEVWTRVVPRSTQEAFFSLPIREWLRDNLFGESLVAGDAMWGIRGRPSWTRPRTGWIKANVDASVSMVDRSAGAGGVLRDDSGAWISGYARYVGRCDALLAELWAIHDGLLLAWDLGFRFVELESDCLEAVRIICSRSNVLSTSALVGAIASLLSREWTVEGCHITRDSNGVADKLAKRGRELGMDSTIFVAAPAVVAGLVEAEQRAAFAPSYAPGLAVDPGGYTR
ncbi:hypothetical protein GQ457_18G022390 [Hibiscus cannabinus]